MTAGIFDHACESKRAAPPPELRGRAASGGESSSVYYNGSK
jgi:hypothetical protein